MFTAISFGLVLFFIAIEYFASKKKGKNLHSFEHSISSISTGILERSLYLLLAPQLYFVFEWLYNNYAWFQIESNAMTLLLLLLATDFVWYWYHRLGHRINLFWAAHIVHHSSDELNLATATRITILQAIIRSVFWCTLPILGFHPNVVTSILIFHGAYSFFTHTQLVNRLGFLEHILITPSHHRVHHACNNAYLDKNFGDVFVFWDKIFGTFQIEDEKPIYGLTHPLKSHSFLWIHFHYYLELITLAQIQKKPIEKIGVLFRSPESMRPGIRRILEKKWLSRKQSLAQTPLKNYIIIQLAIAMTCLIAITLNEPEYTIWEVIAFIFTIALSLVIAGSVIEQKRWSYQLEILRLISLLYLLSSYVENERALILFLLFLFSVGLSVNWQKLYEKHILRLNS
jgi:alkylglycerol monooxygenase